MPVKTAMSTETENRIVSQLETLCEKFDRLEHTITGGDEPARGMIVRLDRLEQARAATDKWLAIVGAAAAMGIVSGIGAVIWKALKP